MQTHEELPARRRIYSAYDPPPAVRWVTAKPTRTRESEAEALDINRIVAQFHRTGLLPTGSLPGLYTDVSQVFDYREAVEQVRAAEGAFMALPAKVRARFENDPAAFLDFCSDPNNRAEMVELGLIERPVAEPPVVPAESPA